MAGTEQEHWPDRTLGILVPTTILCIISTVLLMWRVIYGIRTKRKLLICDYLLIVATVRHCLSSFHYGPRLTRMIAGSERRNDGNPLPDMSLRSRSSYPGS
jgi:multisubunit Na+/H+ antiporter MnhF subunit